MYGRKCRRWGVVSICAGILIILAIIMPTTFWVILLGALFVFAGIMLCRK